MRVIIVIEQNTQNPDQYVVRARHEDRPAAHEMMAVGLGTIEDAAEFASVLSQGISFAGALVVTALSEELVDEVSPVVLSSVYKRDFRTLNFDAVWEVI